MFNFTEKEKNKFVLEACPNFKTTKLTLLMETSLYIILLLYSTVQF